MFLRFFVISLISCCMAGAQEKQLQRSLEGVYKSWRHSIQTRNDLLWCELTAKHRQIAVKNRILSEKREFPAAIFNLPAVPPSLDGLKHLGTKRKGPTAKSYYFGKIDFGLGGRPVENLLILSYVGAATSWKFDQTQYVNLAALPEIKMQLAAGDTTYISNTPELLPTGEIPPNPVEVGPAPFIAKVYAFCPGREVRVQVNKISMHDFINDKDAQLIIGGVKAGKNEIQYTTKDMESDEEIREAMTIRVYLMSEIQGVKPIKVYEYLVREGEKPKGFGSGNFVVDDNIQRRLMGGS